MTTPSLSRYPEAAHPRMGLDTVIVLNRAVVDLADRRRNADPSTAGWSDSVSAAA